MGRKEKQKYQKHKKEVEALDELEAVASFANPKEGQNWNAIFFMFVFGMLLYANTISFDYALDDKLYITANEYTKKGVSGIKEIWTNDMMTGFFGKKKNLVEGGRYRPLALTTHAIEWQIFGKNAMVSHAVNILLYGFMGVILLIVLQQIFENESRDRWWWTVPVVATMIFLAHPTHTEVGANIKSRDEIMSLLFALLSFSALLNYLKRGGTLPLLMSGIWFWLSLASKESTVTFLGVVPLTLIFFPKGNLKKSIISIAPMVVFTFAYLALRTIILDDQGSMLDVPKELMNKPYLNATPDEQMASIFFTMGLYIKLLFWPHPLTHDYYPFHPFHTYQELAAGSSGYVDWSNPLAMAAALIYVVMFGFGLYTLYRKISGKGASILGYSVLFYLGTFILFSNLFFDIGAFMNERFLFIPSLGFALPIAWFLVHKLGKKDGINAGVLLAAALIVVYSGMTIVRNYAWENDYSLATADVGTSDGSSKVKMTMGSELLDRAKKEKNEQQRTAMLKEAENYCLQSLRIYPQYYPPLDILGNIYFEQGNYAESVRFFAGALRIKPYDSRMLNNMEAVANVAVKKKDFETAIKGYSLLTKLLKGKNKSKIYSALGEVYGKELNDLEKAKENLRLARKWDPDNASAYQKIGIVFAMSGQLDSAMTNFTTAYELDTTNARILLNLGILHQQMGHVKIGNAYVQKAYKMDPTVGGEK